MHLLIKRFKFKAKGCLKYKRLYLGLLLIPILASFFTLGCGKRKPPLPPRERVQQRVAIDGTQVGSRIDLTWRMPARNAADGSTLSIQRVDVYRLAEPTNAPLSLTEEEFISRSTVIASVPISDSDFSLKTKTFSDQLKFAGQEARLRYAVRFVNASGQKAAFSNFFLIKPTANIAAGPEALALNLTQTKIELTWKPPVANVNGTTPPNILGYNLYRTAPDQGSPKRINEDSPIQEARYDDRFFKFGERYEYFVRTVSLGGDGEPVESVSSNTVGIKPKDTFSPAPPEAITIAAAPNNISIFFATNLETDVIGYRVYRSTNPNLAKDQWTLLTPQLLKTNTFQDKQVVSAVVYYYYLTAVDNVGNVSSPSEVVSETAF
ncbi:MAG: fibronectin type III domain-containing protein [Pyrinomonadaceae bacterium]|nr:fibronectin type III domain-containing protein [Pyrinomonadaceae bacterium]